MTFQKWIAQTAQDGGIISVMGFIKALRSPVQAF